MVTLYQFGLIMVILMISQLLQNIFNLPIPGTVLGMVILLGLMVFKVIPLKMVEKAADVLIKHLSVMFVPIGVGLMTVAYLLEGYILSLILIVGISLMVVMVTTGLTIQLLIRHMDKRREGSK